MPSSSDPLLARKLTCYHKINELFQNSSMSMFNLVKGVLEIICVGLEAEGGSLGQLKMGKLYVKSPPPKEVKNCWNSTRSRTRNCWLGDRK